MLSHKAGKLSLALTALALAACAEGPAGPTTPSGALKVPPSATANVTALPTIGTSATWVFSGVVDGTGNPMAAVGDTVKGFITFTFTTNDVNPDPCESYQQVTSSTTFQVHGASYTLAGDQGQAVVYPICPGRPDSWIIVNARGGPDLLTGQIQLAYPTTADVFPLTPLPPPLVGLNVFSYWNGRLGIDGWYAILDEIHAFGKADCKGDGYTRFGFRNQGQCVRYAETGKDSR